MGRARTAVIGVVTALLWSGPVFALTPDEMVNIVKSGKCPLGLIDQPLQSQAHCEGVRPYSAANRCIDKVTGANNKIGRYNAFIAKCKLKGASEQPRPVPIRPAPGDGRRTLPSRDQMTPTQEYEACIQNGYPRQGCLDDYRSRGGRGNPQATSPSSEQPLRRNQAPSQSQQGRSSCDEACAASCTARWDYATRPNPDLRFNWLANFIAENKKLDVCKRGCGCRT